MRALASSRQPFRVLDREELVARRPGEQERQLGAAQLLGRLQRVALVHPGRDLLGVVLDAGVVQPRRHPGGDQLVRDLGLGERLEGGAGEGADAERRREHGHAARQLGQRRHRLEDPRREVLVGVAVGQHEAADPLWVAGDENLRHRPAGVVADDRHVLELERGEEAVDRSPRCREGRGRHRGSSRSAARRSASPARCSDSGRRGGRRRRPRGGRRRGSRGRRRPACPRRLRGSGCDRGKVDLVALICDWSSLHPPRKLVSADGARKIHTDSMNVKANPGGALASRPAGR